MTDKEVLKEKLASRLKEAGIWSGIKNLYGKMGPVSKRVLENAAVFGGAGLLLSGGTAAAGALADAVKDPIKKRVGKNRMMRENPWLRHEDNKTVDKYYNTLYRFAPAMAMDPLVSGSFMKKQLEYKDVGIQPTDVNTLANIQKAVGQAKQEGILARAFSPAAIDAVAGTGDLDSTPPRYQ